MKTRIASIILLILLTTACGPRRMKCGVGRKCIVAQPVLKEQETIRCIPS